MFTTEEIKILNWRGKMIALENSAERAKVSAALHDNTIMKDSGKIRVYFASDVTLKKLEEAGIEMLQTLEGVKEVSQTQSERKYMRFI